MQGPAPWRPGQRWCPRAEHSCTRPGCPSTVERCERRVEVAPPVQRLCRGVGGGVEPHAPLVAPAPPCSSRWHPPAPRCCCRWRAPRPTATRRAQLASASPPRLAGWVEPRGLPPIVAAKGSEAGALGCRPRTLGPVQDWRGGGGEGRGGGSRGSAGAGAERAREGWGGGPRTLHGRGDDEGGGGQLAFNAALSPSARATRGGAPRHAHAAASLTAQAARPSPPFKAPGAQHTRRWWHGNSKKCSAREARRGGQRTASPGAARAQAVGYSVQHSARGRRRPKDGRSNAQRRRQRGGGA